NALGVNVAQPGTPFVFTLPEDLFANDYTLGSSIVEVTTLEGASLPGWLHFDPDTMQLAGMPSDGDVGIVGLVFGLVDAGQIVATAPLVIVVEEAPVEEPTGESLAGGS